MFYKLEMLKMLMTPDKKRAQGRYYTVGNPFDCRPFWKWAEHADIAHKTILEPFAGSNSLIEHLEKLDLCPDWRAYDILPGAKGVRRRDTLISFPKNFDVCVTNPPWLAKNSATARKLPFPKCQYDDLYKFALEKCLDNCGWVAALVPESFIRADLFHSRLMDFVSLTASMFEDTAHPVGLALFGPKKSEKVVVWSGRRRVGVLKNLQKHLPKPKTKEQQERFRAVRFNEPDGNLGLIALDNTREPSIRFCRPEELDDYSITYSSRALTKISIPFTPEIDAYNGFLKKIRERTWDVLLTSFRGLRVDGRYRRRLDWESARRIIAHV